MSGSGTLLVQLTAEDLRSLVAGAVADALRDHAAARPPAPDLLGPGPMAARLGVSRTTLHRMRLIGCPSIAVGDSHKYEPAAVLDWLRARGGKAVAA